MACFLNVLCAARRIVRNTYGTYNSALEGEHLTEFFIMEDGIGGIKPPQFICSVHMPRMKLRWAVRSGGLLLFESKSIRKRNNREPIIRLVHCPGISRNILVTCVWNKSSLNMCSKLQYGTVTQGSASTGTWTRGHDEYNSGSTVRRPETKFTHRWADPWT